MFNEKSATYRQITSRTASPDEVYELRFNWWRFNWWMSSVRRWDEEQSVCVKFSSRLQTQECGKATEAYRPLWTDWHLWEHNLSHSSGIHTVIVSKLFLAASEVEGWSFKSSSANNHNSFHFPEWLFFYCRKQDPGVGLFSGHRTTMCQI